MIDFHSFQNTSSYSERTVDSEWKDHLLSFVGNVDHQVAVDMGCGGGLYTKALADIGFQQIYGVDFSEAMLATANENYGNDEHIHLHKGTAYQSGLDSLSTNFYLQRAVLHHLQKPTQSFVEAFRILLPGGKILIQDRTMEDCLLPGSTTHIRGYLYYDFPKLQEIERQRRPELSETNEQLKAAGFTQINHTNLWEIRKRYTCLQELQSDIQSRKGRSILHELTDDEIIKWTDNLENRLPNQTEIIEKDRWTIWTAMKPTV